MFCTLTERDKELSDIILKYRAANNTEVIGEDAPEVVKKAYKELKEKYGED